MFINKVECNCHFPASGSKYYNIGKLTLLVSYSDTVLVSGKTLQRLVVSHAFLAERRKVTVTFNFVSVLLAIGKAAEYKTVF
jgi:hypothetical protein